MLKKIWIFIVGILVIGIICILYFFMTKPQSDLKKIKVAEVTHSIFYTPQYVAKHLGYFEEEGIDAEITLISGADKVTSAVLSGDVEIGFCGSEATIYVYNEGEKDYLVTFAGLTKRDGQFIVSREKIDNFKIEDLYGKEILVGRTGGRFKVL